MGLIVNFTAGTVEGFFIDDSITWGYTPVKIASINEVTVTIGGSAKNHAVNNSMEGTIDRVTGDVDARRESSFSKQALRWLAFQLAGLALADIPKNLAPNNTTRSPSSRFGWLDQLRTAAYRSPSGGSRTVGARDTYRREATIP